MAKTVASAKRPNSLADRASDDPSIQVLAFTRALGDHPLPATVLGTPNLKGHGPTRGLPWKLPEKDTRWWFSGC